MYDDHWLNFAYFNTNKNTLKEKDEFISSKAIFKVAITSHFVNI